MAVTMIRGKSARRSIANRRNPGWHAGLIRGNYQVLPLCDWAATPLTDRVAFRGLIDRTSCLTLVGFMTLPCFFLRRVSLVTAIHGLEVAFLCKFVQSDEAEFLVIDAWRATAGGCKCFEICPRSSNALRLPQTATPSWPARHPASTALSSAGLTQSLHGRGGDPARALLAR